MSNTDASSVEGFDPLRPFTTRDGRTLDFYNIYVDGEIEGSLEGNLRSWQPNGRCVNGRADLINTPVSAVTPTPAGDMAGDDDAPVDPMERGFEKICRENSICFERTDKVREVRIDYYLPDHGVYVELKQYHSDRIAAQMKRVKEIIVIQGRGALQAFGRIARQGARPVPGDPRELRQRVRRNRRHPLSREGDAAMTLDLDDMEAKAREASLPWIVGNFHIKKEGAGKNGFAKTVLTSSAYDSQGAADFAYAAEACLAVPALIARIRELEAAHCLPLEATPEILAAGWNAINKGCTRPVNMAPGPALREAWPAMVQAARASIKASS